MNTNNYNLELIEDLVRTQYGDYGGYIQIDGHSGADLFKLCNDHGIDMDKYFLIGLSAGEHTTTGIGKREKLSFMALVIETAEYGSSFDEIQKNIELNNGVAKAKKVHFNVNYSDLGKYIKRFDFMVATKLTKHISEIEILEDE
ncbi:hypothetical protein LX97_02954 [Nonlabens dokdonensis]|jgi:hypothetical protein|uniref:Uncharacterized protein n=2 Tax=Nonlabens dokdonensis TaxID=328515 RepID=L7WDC5_NONDD|nr:hypothetical protein [Nonlabens dokdonensis]AGC78252.1 hypothetical protein DDD_3125 [Nonlabens dokdonensis DSW-6]PZX37859.1 hypothetical protein LX97_02954 [Nonlabens dokdonensis]